MMESARHRQAYHHEWILTNGLGGYALSLGNLLNERKYAGLLVAGLQDHHRVHVLSGLEEKVEYQSQAFFLDANHYPDCIHPQGYNHLVKSWIRPHVSLLYSTDPLQENVLVLKELFLIPGRNAVLISYHNLGRAPLSFNLRPKFTLRNHHFINKPGCWDGLAVEHRAEGLGFSLSRPDNGLKAFGHLEDGLVLDDPTIYRNVFYPYEAARGYEAVEDQFSPVEIRFSLPPEGRNRLVIGLDELAEPFAAAAEAEAHYLGHPLPADHPRRLDRSGDWL